MGDLYVVMTVLQKALQKSTGLMNVIHNQSHSFTPNLPNNITLIVDKGSDQG